MRSSTPAVPSVLPSLQRTISLVCGTLARTPSHSATTASMPCASLKHGAATERRGRRGSVTAALGSGCTSLRGPLPGERAYPQILVDFGAAQAVRSTRQSRQERGARRRRTGMARVALIKVFTGLNLGVCQLSGELLRAGHE